ncbi:xylosyltransferase 1-like [Loxodonta africana]|uniref:xylosyltransferase 1-like n=1 Tax=Loxodonta africana TaxID=9785 RepID=UPI0030D4CD63
MLSVYGVGLRLRRGRGHAHEAPRPEVAPGPAPATPSFSELLGPGGSAQPPRAASGGRGPPSFRLPRFALHCPGVPRPRQIANGMLLVNVEGVDGSASNVPEARARRGAKAVPWSARRPADGARRSRPCRCG